MVTGWNQIGNQWHYANSDGTAYNGWLNYKNNWYYIKKATMQTGFFTSPNGVNYIFDKNGIMLTNTWTQINKKWYYLLKSGAMANGWQKIKNEWYYFDNSIAVTGVHTINGSKYTFNNNCQMVTGWSKADNQWTYTDSNGNAYNGWLNYKNNWYYIKKGIMLTGQFTSPNDVTYLFNKNGIMLTNTWIQRFGGYWFYLLKSGAMANGWQKIDGKWYYFYESEAVRGVERINGKQYVFNNNCQLASGWTQYITHNYVQKGPEHTQTLNNPLAGLKEETSSQWLYANTDGTAYNGWLYYKNNWYYINYGYMLTGYFTGSNNIHYITDKNGIMLTNTWNKNGGCWYYLLKSGAAAIGWNKINGKWYYFYSGGIMATGELPRDNNNKIYILSPSGSLLTNTWNKIDNERSYSTASGALATGLQTINGKKYYFDIDGTMQTGLQTINNLLYYFNNNGTMHKGWLKVPNKGMIYFNKFGQEVSSWYYINNNWYYFTTNYTLYNTMATGTLNINGPHGNSGIYKFGSNGVYQGNFPHIVTPLNYNKFKAMAKSIHAKIINNKFSLYGDIATFSYNNSTNTISVKMNNITQFTDLKNLSTALNLVVPNAVPNIRCYVPINYPFSGVYNGHNVIFNNETLTIN